MRKKYSFIPLLFALVSFGCSSSKRMGIDRGELLGIEWKLVSVRSAQSCVLLTPQALKAPTLTFSSDGKTAFGNSGCNRFTGGVTWNGSKLTFGAIAGTKMLCMDGMEIGNAVLKAFQKTSGYEIDKGNLLLKKGREVLASLTPAK